MKSRLIINVLLLLLIAVVGFFAFKTDNKTNQAPRVLTDIKAASINKISIRHNDRTIDIEKKALHWQLTAPINIAANDFRIGTIMKMLETVSHAKYDAGALDLKRFGLENTTTSISFNEHRIDFGIVNPIKNYRYVKLNNEVHLIDDHYYPLISSQLGTLAARNLLPADSKITRLTLPEQTLSRDAEGKWLSTGDVSADRIIETINHWKTTEAFGVHDYNERVPLDAIKVRTAASDKPIVFFITDVDPWLIIARPDIGLEYHFNLEFYDLLLRPGAVKNLPDEFGDDEQPQTAPLRPL